MEETPTPPFVVAERYEVSAEIGRGGFAIVYQARDRVFERDVAIKILREETLTPSALRRFSLEMRVTASLEHPNILHVYDTGMWNSRMYYVMEYVRGHTLEARLAAEGALPIEDSLKITREVGQALQFAHDRGIIHRDVKPANILIGAGGALLADFGIARVLSEGQTGPITSTGLAVGTMQYMSPEQLCAEPRIDARTDQYSLALVCYEMLTGVRPHVASSMEALRALRMAGSYASVAIHRPSVPLPVDEAVRRGLSPTAADRFRGVNDFVLALDRQADAASVEQSNMSRNRGGGPRQGDASGNGPLEPPATPKRRRRPAMAAVALAGVALPATLYLAHSFTAHSPDPSGDGPPTVAILEEPGVTDSSFQRQVRAELEVWRDVPMLPVARMVGPIGDRATLDAVASRANSRILLAPLASTDGDSTHWTLSVFDAATHQQRRLVRVLGRSLHIANADMRFLMVQALFGSVADSAAGLANLGDPNWFAAKAYINGWHLMRDGRFDSAAKSFASAAARSPLFGEAHLWAAQIGAWTSPKVPAQYREEAQQAIATHQLSAIDSILAEALIALARDPAEACKAYREAIDHAPESFVARYGFAQCQQIDSIVIRDTRVPGGRRFRSSNWSSLAAYTRAVELLPTARMSALFDRVAAGSYASGNEVRHGVSMPPDTSRFAAFPSLAGDSVETIPVPRDSVEGKAGLVPVTLSEALQRVRHALLGFTKSWVAQAQTSSDAWFYRAYSLELAGQLDAPERINSAAQALAKADSLQTDEEDRARIDVARVRVAARSGDFAAATRLARLALSRRGPVSPHLAISRAPLAAFLGDADQTTRLLKTAAATTDDEIRRELPPWAANALPSPLADSLRSLAVRAALGICDRLAARRDALERDFRAQLSVSELEATRQALLPTVYRSALPCLGSSALRGFRPETRLDEAVAALDAGNTRLARTLLDSIGLQRRGVRAGTITEDAVLIEAWVRMQTGDTVSARQSLLANLQSLSSISAFTFDEVAQAAAIARIRDLATGALSKAGSPPR